MGEWVKIRCRNANAAWNGLQGPVTKVEEYEITVRLNDDTWKCLRFYRDELVKVTPPNEALNAAVEAMSQQSFYKRGDIVLIDCPMCRGIEIG